MTHHSLDMPEPTPEKRRSGRLLFGLAVVLLLAAGGYCVFLRQDADTTTPLMQTNGERISETAMGSDDVGNDLHLALKNVNLSQGEGGFELWRLKAEWASVRKQDEMIIVEKPHLTYFIKDGGSPMLVESVTGSLDQRDRVLRFIDAVRVSQDSKLLTSDMLVYRGDEKTMTFPYGGEFSDTGISGSAGHLVWRIDEKRIDASSGVFVHFVGSSKKQDSNSVIPQKKTDTTARRKKSR